MTKIMFLPESGQKCTKKGKKRAVLHNFEKCTTKCTTDFIVLCALLSIFYKYINSIIVHLCIKTHKLPMCAHIHMRTRTRMESFIN